MHTSAAPADQLRRGRIGTTATFGLLGFLLGAFTGRIPTLMDELRLSTFDLGLSYFVWGVGGLAATQAMRFVMARIGSSIVLRVAAPLFVLSVLVVATTPDKASLLLNLGLFGAAFGTTEAAARAQASAVERAHGLRLVSGIQAGWPVGAVAGGACAAVMAHVHVPFAPSLAASAMAVLPVACVLPFLALPPVPATPGVSNRMSHPRRRLSPVVYLLGALSFSGFVLEDAVTDWAGVLLTGDLASSAVLAALTYPSFQIGMFTGRLCADRLRSRLSTGALVSGVGLAATAGVLSTAALTQPAFVLAAIFAAGVGISALEPLAVSLTGDAQPEHADAAVAQVGVFGYLGTTFGPIAMSVLAELTGLRTALAIVAVVMGLVVVTTGRLLTVPLLDSQRWSRKSIGST